MRTTYSDAVVHLVDYLGGNPAMEVQRDCKRAIQEAYRDLANAHRWTYLLRHGRVVTSAPFSGGTITYDAATNRVTLVGATWPSWASSGYLRLTSTATTDAPEMALYRAGRRIDDATLALDDEVNPGVDLDVSTYSLYRDTYLLPEDYIANDQTLLQQSYGGMEYVHPRDWLFDARYTFVEGDSRLFTVTGDPQFPGRLVMRVIPFPTSARSIDFLYLRRPRPLAVHALAIGTATTQAGSATVVGQGTTGTWAPGLIGSVIRISGQARLGPTGVIGENPPAFEGTILGIDPTSILPAFVVDAPVPVTLAGMPFVISDPLDLEDGAMLNAFWRCAEMHLATGRTLKDKPSAMPMYRAALIDAKQADSRSFAGRRVGECGPFRQRLRDMPFSFAIE